VVFIGPPFRELSCRNLTPLRVMGFQSTPFFGLFIATCICTVKLYGLPFLVSFP